MRKFGWHGLGVVLIVLLAGCAGQPKEETTLEEKLAAKGYALGGQVTSVRDWNLNGWVYVDDRHFIMESGVRDRYLVTLRQRSLELGSAINLAFSTTVGSLTDKDKVILRGAGGFRETLMIESLHALARIEKDAARDPST
jgi:hypothetical protein